MVTTPDSAAAARPNALVRAWQGMWRFFREVRIELKKTNWPSRDELTKYVVVVLMTIFVVAVLLFVLDKGGEFISTRVFKLYTR